MRTTLTCDPQIIHAIPGRVRIHLPGWSKEQQRIESRLLLIPGVSSVQANPLTGNVLIRFDSALTAESILRAVRVSIPAQPAAMREHEASAQAQPKNDSPMCPARPPRPPMTDIALFPTATVQPMPTQLLLRLNPSRAKTLITTRLKWLPEPKVAHEVAHSQVLQANGKLVEVCYPHDVLAVSRPTVRLTERHVACMTTSGPGPLATTTIQARQSSILRHILRALLAPGVAAFLLKATSVILGLARASSPLGLVLGGIEILQLLAEAHCRWSAFTPASGYAANRMCMECQVAF